MTRSLPVLAALLFLAACDKEEGPRSLVGNFPAPGTHAVARDTIVVWQRQAQPDGSWRFRSYAITPGGGVQFLEQSEHGDYPSAETAPIQPERRKEFVLPPAVLERIRLHAALLRPTTLGPANAAGGYGGEAFPIGCAATPRHVGEAGINFINDANWGAFVLPPSCDGEAARKVMQELLGPLDRAAGAVPYLR